MQKVKNIEKQILFSENQRFRQIWIWGLILSPVVISLFTYFSYAELEKQQGNSAISDNQILILLIVFGVALPLAFYFAELKTRITHDGIYIKFLPFHHSWLLYSFSEIKSSENVRYRPLLEYGGWGIRYGLHGKAYNVSGNKGIRLTFLNGKNLLIGSQKTDEFESVLQKITNKSISN